MSQSFLPQFGMPIVDKNGKATMQLQQFFMQMAKSGAGVKVTVQGQSQTANALSFGAGFSGNYSGTTWDLSTGIGVSGSGLDYPAVTKLEFGDGFSLSGAPDALTINGGGTALTVMQNGVLIGKGVDLINLAGSVTAKVEGGELYLVVGGVQINSDGGSYSNIVSGPNITLTGDEAGNLTIGSQIGVEYAGTIYSTLLAGSNATLTPGTAGLEISTSGGSGGSSAYITPKLSDFSIANQPSGSSFADTSTGLLFSAPDGPGTLNLQALLSSTVPSSTSFTLTAGMRPTSAPGGNTGMGVFVVDGSGKIFQFGINAQSGNITCANLNYWNSYTSFNSNPLTTNDIYVNGFVQVQLSSGTFTLSSGTDLNNMLVRGTVSATGFIGTPVGVGLYQYLYHGASNVEFIHFTLQ